jgi:sialate O-acetylesterase
VLSTAITLFAVIAEARGDVRLPAIFSHNMVLQQNRDVPVWGWAAPGEKVMVSFAGHRASATADQSGRWATRLPVPAADGIPGTLVVQGNNQIVRNNAVAGEVWLCSGQSNMQVSLGGVTGGKEATAAAKLPMLRLFQVRMSAAAEPRQDLEGAWAVCSPETAGGFSAVGFFLGRRLHQDLKVPVGVIDSTSGGTAVEAWISRHTLDSDPAMKRLVRPDPEFFKILDQYDRDRAQWEQARAENRRPMPPDPNSPFRGWGYPTSIFYNAMIAPLAPYAIQGAAWYQGEARTGRPEQYAHELSTLIGDWRLAWGSPFTFLVVQLPNIKPTWNWPITREQQQQVARTVSRVGLVVTIDVGGSGDLHPPDKRPVGERLALTAEAMVYGRNVVCSGPVFDTMKLEGNNVRLHFKCTSGGLVARGGGDVNGFSIAGADRKFVPPKAVIEGDTVVVSDKGIARPAAVRYAFEDDPVCNLFNGAGLPACPFRTDDWPLGGSSQ